MKILIPLFILLFSCKNHVKNESKVNDEVMDSQQNLSLDDSLNSYQKNRNEQNKNQFILTQNDLLGIYVGWFVPNIDSEELGKKTLGNEAIYWDRQNKINISIDSIRDGSVYGHSVVAGNMRVFNGRLSESANAFVIEAREPGTDKYDGLFKMKFRKGSIILKGNWTAYKKIDISQRSFHLGKTLFSYNPNLNIENSRSYVDWNKMKVKKEKYKYENEVYEEISESFSTSTNAIYKINASVKLLTKKDVENLKKGDLLIIRNAIYARHGYSFKNRTLRVFFDQQDWYIPYTIDIKSKLTEIELKNIELLLKYEKNAEEYYDTFGRG